VTGASKGIGQAIARAMLGAGGHVIAHYGGDKAGAEEAVADAPERATLIAADFQDPANVTALWDRAVQWRGRVNVLVNNAAIMRLKGGIEDSEENWDAVWDETVRVNILSPAKLMRSAVRHFLEAGGGTVISLGSWAAYRGTMNPNGMAYATSKAAVAATTKAVARSYAGRGVLAFVIAPGVVRTRLSVESAATMGGEAAVSAGLAMGEWIPPEELAELAVFLASGRCRHLNGATLDVNGASYIR